MRVKVYETEETLKGAVAETAAESIRKAANEGESAEFRLCLGADKINAEMLRELVTEDVNWKNVKVYFSWEFLGEQGTSAISRRKRITYNFTDRLTTFRPENLRFSDSELLTEKSAEALNKDAVKPFDLIFTELLPNGGVCMNVPPCNFDTRSPYINTRDFLDSPCVTVSPYKILTSRRIVAIASGEHMAKAVGLMFESDLSAMCPSSILREHPDFILMCDKAAARYIPACYFD